jgi:hypothetical protein
MISPIRDVDSTGLVQCDASRIFEQPGVIAALAELLYWATPLIENLNTVVARVGNIQISVLI